MSGATDPLRPVILSIRSTTTPSNEEDKRHEQALIARLLDQAVNSPRNIYGVTMKARRHVFIGGMKYITESMSPSSLQKNERPIIGGVKLAFTSTSSSCFENVEGSERLTPADMKRLAASGIRTLVAHVNSGAMRPAQLALAAELIGDMGDRVTAERTLLALLRHDSPLVREGAVYGLAKLDSPSSLEALRLVAYSDRSPGVREAATEALDV